MATHTIFAYFESAVDGPMTAPVTLPRVTVIRGSDLGEEHSDVSMVNAARGGYRFTFTTSDNEEYWWIADGDPLVAGQTKAGGRYDRGSASGTDTERNEVDIPRILSSVSGIAIGGLTVDPFTSTIHAEVWLMRDGARVAGATDATIDVYAEGAVTPITNGVAVSSSPNARGIFTFALTPVSLTSRRVYTVDISVTDVDGTPIQTHGFPLHA